MVAPWVAADLKTGFEKASAGEIRELKTAAGTWQAEIGHAEVTTKYHYTGKQCLHILGGRERRIDFTPGATIKMPVHLVFQAERWTSRKPFAFRVQQRIDDKWVDIFNGDRAVVVGRAFKSRVEIPLKACPDKLRFICTSPDRSGILIDDIALIAAAPQKVVSVTVEDVRVPVLRGLEVNPLLRVRVETTGTLKPIALNEVVSLLSGSVTDKDLAAVQWLASGGSPNVGDAEPFGKAAAGKIGSHTFAGKQTLRAGANYFWLSVKLNDRADIDHTLLSACSLLKFSDGSASKILTAGGAVHRLGVAVRQHGQDGVHTSRIPGLATTPKGTLIGVYDLRNRSGGDLPGDIDVGMSRSADGGRTWEPTRTIMDMGRDVKWHYDGIGDPAVLVDRNAGTIWVAATWSHGNRSWVGSGPGMKPGETGQLMLVRSDDEGRTWSKPINITAQVKKPEWCFLLQGPGKGITMADGTLVFAAQFQDAPENNRLSRSTILFSKDHGKTWQLGTGAYDDTTEAQVAEIELGVLMLNCRYNRENRRVVMVTRDMGRTWQEHPTHRKTLIEPRACMASLISVDGERTGKPGPRLLFSNPNSIAVRQRITIKASRDRGLTWPEESQMLLDEWRGAGYSCLSMIDNETVGILYEGSRAHMTFQRVNLKHLFAR
ncbi:MAG: exo-alpha-sialidase [Verrucomicrobiota bacterium]|nr:exo-alpha-sialidase [Verrucomicrobiota bacterium]